MFDLTWMAWTWQTAAFFTAIGGLLVMMTAWEYLSPGGAPRVGILGLDTTRGDRLFISLLGSAFIHLAWLGLRSLPWNRWLSGTFDFMVEYGTRIELSNLWWALGLSLVYAVAVFRWV